VRPLYLHIGLQKSGSSYLQSTFWGSRAELRRQGMELVPGSVDETFELMLDVTGQLDPAIDRPRAAGALARLPEQLAACPSDRVLITEESFSAADADQIRRLGAALDGFDVRVVVTARDLGRAIPSAWQQALRRGVRQSLDDFVERAQQRWGEPGARLANQNLAAILDRWAALVGPESVHVVVVPQRGAPRTALLERFCAAVEVEPDALATEVAVRNESIGRVQAEVLRRVNQQLPRELIRRDLRHVTKSYFAGRVLGAQGGEPITLSRAHESWCRQRAEEFIEHTAALGCVVHGDLGELRPAADSFSDAPAIAEQEIAASATTALARMLEDRLRDVDGRQRAARQARQTRQAPTADRGAWWRRRRHS